jgi:hypothetical protein
MLTDLKRALDSTGHNDSENDLRRAARELLAQQFLFAENRRQRASYAVVTRHYAYFDKLFDALGWSLQRDDRFGYVGIVPLAEESHRLLKLDETLVLLLCRLLYEEAAEASQIEAGAAFVDGEALLNRYELLLGRERPKRARVMEILRLLRSHGLLQVDGGDSEEAPRLRLLPSLRAVTGDAVLEQLAGYVQRGEEVEDAEEAEANSASPVDDEIGSETGDAEAPR